MEYQEIFLGLLEKIWEEPLNSNILSRRINVSNYCELEKEIPDQFILIEEVFPENDINDIFLNYKPYIGELEILPFLGTLGEATICIGFGKLNKGKIFYFDFDFGCFSLDDSLDEFIAKLESK